MPTSWLVFCWRERAAVRERCTILGCRAPRAQGRDRNLTSGNCPAAGGSFREENSGGWQNDNRGTVGGSRENGE